MAKPLVSDGLWEMLQPLLPPAKPRRFRYPGRKRIDGRKALTGILFVLRSGIPWEMLPREMGCGSGMTCWRRLKEWHEAGVWPGLHELLLSKLQGGRWSGLEPRRCGQRPTLVQVGPGGWRRGKKPAPILRTAASLGASIT